MNVLVLSPYLKSEFFNKDINVYVIVTDESKEYHEEHNGNTHVHFVGNSIKWMPNPLLYHLTVAGNIEQRVSELVHSGIKFDFIHSFEWDMLPAAMALKIMLGIPLFISLNSTENMRTNMKTKYSKAIRKIEWQGFYEASKIIVNNYEIMYNIIKEYQVPCEKFVLCDDFTKEWIENGP